MTHHKSEPAKIKPQTQGDTAKLPAARNQNRNQKKSAPKKITEQYLHNSGLYYLQRFAASKAHFITVLTRKAHKSCHHHKDQNLEDCAVLIAKTADKFEECGLLNDQLYTRGVITSLRRRGLSRNVILNKLAEKGIPRAYALETLQQFDEEESHDPAQAEKDAALRLARKKKVGPYSNTSADGKQIDRRKALAYFARAGFSFDIANKILNLPPDFEDDIS
jgi:regulatory protein